MINEKEKSNIGTVIKVAAGAAVAFFAAVSAGVVFLYRRSMKRMKDQEEKQNNKMEIIALGSHKTTVGQDVDNAYLSCLLGKNVISFEEVPSKNVLLDVCGIFSSLTIIVPESVKVVCDVELAHGKLCEELPADEETEGTPTVKIIGRMVCSTINVEREGE